MSLKKLNIQLSGISPLVIFLVISVVIFTLFRLGLTFWKYDLCKDNLSDIFIYGLRYDLSINATMLIPAVIAFIIAGYSEALKRYCTLFLKLYLPLVLTVQLFVELTTIPFIEEYGVRPNKIYVEYLIYPKEVFSMLASGHLKDGFICIGLSALAFYLLYKLAVFCFKDYKSYSKKLHSIVTLLLIVLIPLGIRGAIGHKPLNPSSSMFSTSPLVNTIPMNSCFSVFYNLKHLKDDEVSGNQIYAFDTPVNVLNNLKYLSERRVPEKTDSTCPINQVITPSISITQKRNVVIVLEESLGARYVKSLGGDPVTPNLDRLKEEGWWFERMYATGHRSVRGIEAVTASYPPSPLSSQVKLEHDYELTTVSSIFKKLGYKTSFIYGGESHFDNMRRYFLSNGVDEIIEQKDYENPSFVASWGVSDEDLFKKANSYFKELAKSNTPFCSVVFSSSFHDPFDIPEGKVSLDGLKTDDPKRLLAVKYADYALGKFFDDAKKEDYYKNTIFIVIADHDSRVRGINAFPLEKYSIPALIISPDLSPRTDRRIVSQIDMLPTLLSLNGISGEFPLVGQDLTKDKIIERAIIAYNEIFAYYHDDKLVVLSPQQKLVFNVGEHNHVGDLLKDGDSYDVSKEVSFLNIPLTLYKHRYSDFSCVRNLKQNGSAPADK